MAKEVLSNHYTLGQLYADLVEHGSDSISHRLCVLEQCLLRTEGIDREPGDLQHAQKIFDWVTDAIRPVGDILIHENSKKIEDLGITSTIVFKCIRHLQINFLLREMVNPDALLSIIAYTDAEDPWTHEETQVAADQALAHHQEQVKSHKFVVEHVLVRFIRPLFSGSQVTLVTSQGRKAVGQTVQKPRHLYDLDASKTTWKCREVSVMTVLRWAVRNMDESMVQKNWHLCIPPVLTLLDDSFTMIRLRGLLVLGDLVVRIPSKILRQTGLGDVFEDAVIPTLLFLPELTPIEESISLLKSAYLALLSLGEARYSTKEERSSKMRFLDRVMRQGVLQGFIHSGDNVRIAELLVKQTINLVDSMGVHSVKYLKDILPILSKILTDPFGLSHPKLLLAASKATQTIVVNCWPRMIESSHRIEIVKALTLCWTIVNGEIGTKEDRGKSLELEAIKQELRLAGSILYRSVSEKQEMTEELQPLIHVDPSLSSLFGLDEAVG